MLVCNFQEDSFLFSDHLKIHMKTHDNRKPYQCDQCNRGFCTAAALASHQQHHTKKDIRPESRTSCTSTVSVPSPESTREIQVQEVLSRTDVHHVRVLFLFVHIKVIKLKLYISLLVSSTYE